HELPVGAVGGGPQVESSLRLQDALDVVPLEPVPHFIAGRPAQEDARVERADVEAAAEARHVPDVADEEVVEPASLAAQRDLEAAGGVARSARNDLEVVVRVDADQLGGGRARRGSCRAAP